MSYATPFEKYILQVVQPAIAVRQGVKIPLVHSFIWPDVNSQGTIEPDVELWKEDVAHLFEWVGMACLGSKRCIASSYMNDRNFRLLFSILISVGRLQVNDNPDPYIAVYAPPEPSHIGDLVHIRWHGLLPPLFIKQVIEIALYVPELSTFILSIHVMKPSSHVTMSTFVSVTASCVPTSPVSYVPSALGARVPRRAPRDDAEDTWSLILSRSADSLSDGSLKFVLAESIGQWDERWG